MVLPSAEGMDLFKIAGRTISGWIPNEGSHAFNEASSGLRPSAYLPNAATTIWSSCMSGARRFPPLLNTLDEDIIDRKSTRLNSSHSQISYADFCLKLKP